MAAVKKRAPETRAILAQIRKRLALKGSTSEKRVDILKQDHADVFKKELLELAHIGAMKIASEGVGGATVPKAQIEMFNEYDLPKMLVLRTVDNRGHVQKVHKAIAAVTIGEALKYIEDNSSKPRGRRSARVAEIVRLVDDVKEFGKEGEGSTIGQCWETAQKAAGGE